MDIPMENVELLRSDQADDAPPGPPGNQPSFRSEPSGQE